MDLRQLPQVDEVVPPPPPTITESLKVEVSLDDVKDECPVSTSSPKQKNWHEVKEKKDDTKKTPSKLDLVRAKLAEATKGKDRLGRPLLFSKSPSKYFLVLNKSNMTTRIVYVDLCTLYLLQRPE